MGANQGYQSRRTRNRHLEETFVTRCPRAHVAVTSCASLIGSDENVFRQRAPLFERDETLEPGGPDLTLVGVRVAVISLSDTRSDPSCLHRFEIQLEVPVVVIHDLEQGGKAAVVEEAALLMRLQSRERRGAVPPTSTTRLYAEPTTTTSGLPSILASLMGFIGGRPRSTINFRNR